MKNTEIIEFTDKELLEKLDDEVGGFLKTKMSHAASSLQDTSQVKKIKKNIARIKTELRKREFLKIKQNG